MPRLTALKIEQAKPRKDASGEFVRTEIPDAGQPGLRLIIQPNGSKSWAIRYRNAAGQQRKYTLDSFCSLATAHKLARKALDEIAEGHDPAAAKQVRKATERDPQKDDDTFAAVAARFIHRYARKEKKLRSWQEVARLLGLRPDPHDNKMLLEIKGGLAHRDRWGKRRIGEISKKDVIKLVDDLADEIVENGGTGVGANRTLAALRKLFNWAVSRDIIPTSPCNGVARPVPENKRKRILSDDEVRWFWYACDKLLEPSEDKRTGESLFGHAFKLLLLTGQRRREIGRMTIAELNLESATLSLSGERTKNKRDHVVPLSPLAVEVIKAVPRITNPAGFVFCTNGNSPISGWSKAKGRVDELMLQATREEAQERGEDPTKVKVEPWRLHDLRRTASTRMAKIGTPPHVIEAALNHISGAKAGVAGIYNQEEYAPEKRIAMDGLARHIDAIVTGKTAKVVPMVRTMVGG